MTTQYNTLDMKYSEALDAVNTWVDDILCKGIPPTMATTDAAATPPVHNTDSSPSSPPTDGASTSPLANVVPDSAPDGRMDLGASKNMPRFDAPDRHLESRHTNHSDQPNLPREHNFRDTGGSTSVRWRPQLDPCRLPHANGMYRQEEGNFDHYQGSPRTPSNPYYESHDTRNESAHSDPRQYTAHVPPHTRRPQEVGVDYGSDDEARLPQGGQIVSPRHWDRRQLAHTAGNSSLDAAALACWEYHGYQKRYYPFTAEIIKSCGYKDAR